MCVDVYGWVGGYLVVPTLHLHLHLHYLYSPFLFLLSSSTCSSYSLVFSFGYHLQGKSSYNPAKKIPEKATKFLEVWSWECYITYLPSEFHFVFLVANTGTLVVTKRRRMRRERKKNGKFSIY